VAGRLPFCAGNDCAARCPRAKNWICEVKNQPSGSTEGMGTAKAEYIGKRVRKYYSLSVSGKAKTKEKVHELAGFMDTRISLLNIKSKLA
jgi:hypothetical protein